MEEQANPTTSASATVDDDRACARCGYNLRGLSPDGRCPECGALVARSLHGNFLRYADADWLEKLRLATRVKLWNIVLSLFLGIGVGILVGGLPREIKLLVASAAALVGVWASFLITTQEPRIALKEDPVTWRRAIRICVFGGAAGHVMSDFNSTTAPSVMLQVLSAVGVLVGVFAIFGELLYLCRFAKRIPDLPLAKATRAMMWSLAIAVGLIIIAVIGALARGTIQTAVATLPRRRPTVGGLTFLTDDFVCVIGVAWLVFSVWYIQTLLNYKKAFTDAATHARAIGETPQCPALPGDQPE